MPTITWEALPQLHDGGNVLTKLSSKVLERKNVLLGQRVQLIYMMAAVRLVLKVKISYKTIKIHRRSC